MATAPPTSSACPVCEQPLPADTRATCPGCRTPPATLELFDALDFAARRFEQWHRDGQLNAAQHQAIADFYRTLRQEVARTARAGEALPGDLQLTPATQCWSCGAVRQGDSLCDRCGAPLTGPGVRSLRYLTLLQGEITRQAHAGHLSLAQAHALLGEVRGRIAALHNRLEKDRVPVVQAAPRQAPPQVIPVLQPAEPDAPRKPLLELLLDPRNIQWLLVLGGGLLALGLVIWLTTLRLFEDPRLIAILLGVANGAALLGGWALIRGTRLQMAGRALTLLACLVMPFNLWFYDAHHLITLESHLWLPALVCCALYAASALLLRDPLFVPVLMFGVALTGLLILADRGVNRFWEVASPAALLVALGLVGILAERAFSKSEGPFGRRRFGLAFFFSGHALLGAGLLFLLGAQLVGWSWMPALDWELRQRPAIVSEPGLKVLALGLFLAGFAAYLYSDLVVRKVGVYVYLAAFCLLWSELLALLALPVAVPSEAIILMLALTACAANLLQASQAGRSNLARALPPLGVLLTMLPLLYGLVLHLRATAPALREIWRRADGGYFTFSWSYVGAMLATALACRLGAYLYRRSHPQLSVVYFFLTGAATLVGSAGLAWVLGLTTWDTQAPVLMLLPIAYLLASRLYRGSTPEGPLVWVAHAATGAMLVWAFLSAVDIDPVQVFAPQQGQTVNLLLALFFAEAAVFYSLAAVWRRDDVIYFGAAAACGAVWQLLHFFEVPGEYHPVAFAVVGFALLLAYRLAVLDRYRRNGLARAAFACANALLSLSFAAAALLTLGRLLALNQNRALFPERTDWEAPLQSLAVVLVVLAVLSLAGAALVRHTVWRRLYAIAALVEGLLTFLVLNALSGLSPWEKFEVFCVAVGVILLGLAHWGWYREDERQDDLVSLGLVLGSLAVAGPLVLAVLIHRSTAYFSTFNELGLMGLGLVLLSTGVLFRLKATAVGGGVMVGFYVLTLPMFLRTPRWLTNLESASLWMIFGGGSVFGVGLLLSVFRDRLLALPDKIRRREGIFRLLSWR